MTHLFAYENFAPFHAFMQDRTGLSYNTQQENVSPDGDLSLSAATEEKLKRKHPEEFALYGSISR